MKLKLLLIFSIVSIFISCNGESISRHTPNENNFPVAVNVQKKNIYIILRKTKKETRSYTEIKRFVSKRIKGAGMRSKMAIKGNYIYITIENKNIPKPVLRILKTSKDRAKKYFKELLEQKIEITFQMVDSSYMESLPPGLTIDAGDYFGKVVSKHYKSQLRPSSNAGIYPVIKKGESIFMVIRHYVLLRGIHILSARVKQTNSRPWILLKFNETGAMLFSRFTRRYIQERIAILVNGWVLAAPVVAEHIPDGQAWITGVMSEQRALQLAAFFNATGGFGLKLERLNFK